EVVQEAVGRALMLRIPDKILREAGLFGHRRDELLVVEGDAQLLRQLLGDEPPAGTIFPADGDDNVLHKDTSYPTSIIIQTGRFVTADLTRSTARPRRNIGRAARWRWRCRQCRPAPTSAPDPAPRRTPARRIPGRRAPPRSPARRRNSAPRPG